MLRKYCKVLCLILSIFMILSCFTACGSSNNLKEEINGIVGAPSYDMEFDGFTDSVNKGDYETSTPGSSSTGKEENVATNRKIIEEYEMTIETKEFDKLLPLIKDKAKELGGYVESSSTDNNRYSRYAYFTIRIPQGASESFNGFISENSNVVYSETKTTDVTLTYVDIQSRIESYKAEKAKLEELMEKATNLSDVLQIQNRLTDVI